MGQMCNALIRELRLGSAANSSRGILERMHEFNDGAREPGAVRARGRKKEEEKPGKRRKRKGRRGKGEGRGKGSGPGGEKEREKGGEQQAATEKKVRRLRRKVLDIKNFFIRVRREKLVPRVQELIK